MFNYTLIKK